MSSLFLMVTITDRRSTDAFLQLYQQRGVDVNLRTVGSGTAVRETLATLGLEKTEKAVLLAVVALLLLKKVVRHWTGITACTLILSGGIGNIIDRIVHGYVVDMFDLTLFSYPVFNFADCCVVVGAILGAVYYLFFYDKYDKRERPHGNDTPDGDK